MLTLTQFYRFCQKILKIFRKRYKIRLDRIGVISIKVKGEKNE
jgi:hypothetical protein